METTHNTAPNANQSADIQMTLDRNDLKSLKLQVGGCLSKSEGLHKTLILDGG